MLVKFDSSAGTLIMFGDAAVQLLKLMGHTGTVPGAILAPDLPQAVARLEAALGALPPDQPPAGEHERADDSAKVSLRQRAYPLIELMRRAARANVDLLWGKA